MRHLTKFVIFIVGLSGVARCSTFTFATPSTATFNSLPVDFTVTITTAADTITVVLDDRTTNPTADTQGISGLSFILNQVVSNTPAFSLTPQGQAAGTLINIPSKTAAYTIDTTDTVTHWQVSRTTDATSTTVNMNVFSGGSPNDLIIGYGAADDIYHNANNSIIGHNPYILHEGIFVINLPGVTTDTTVSTISTPQFNVGTATPQIITSISAVPEPGTLALLAVSVVPLAIFRRRRQSSFS